MSYLYYPGCSLKSTGRAFEESLLAVLSALDVQIPELEDWNCCGATAYMSISELKAFALCARNFALAEQQLKDEKEINLVIPCAACYLGLNKAWHYINEHEDLRSKINEALKSADLSYKGHVRIRHPMDVFINDFGKDKIAEQVTRPLTGMRIACYYGCQILRPYSEFDDQHNPSTMEKIVECLGATPVDWPLKTRCCGGSLTGTIQEVGFRLSYILLKEAKKRGCDAIITACPLCQFNLECYQSQIGNLFGDILNMPVLYFTQLMGIAFGIKPKKLGLHRLFIPARIPPKSAVSEEVQHVRN
jgi:heterodisulfide reductase subunit B